MAKAMVVTLVVIFLNLSSAWADGPLVRGSDAIVCRDPNGQIKSAELFDYYEGRVLRDMPIDVEAGVEDVKVGVENLLKRLARVAPLKVAAFRQGTEEFLRDAYFLSGQVFPDIIENDPVAVPVGCHEEQVVLQKPDGLPGEKRFTINKDIWDAMRGASKAGLVFHEALFAHLVSKSYLGFSNGESDRLRYFNEVLASSDEITALNTDQKVMDLFKMVGFNSTDIRGIDFMIWGAKFYPNGALMTAYMREAKPDFSVYGQVLRIGGITFFSDSTVKSVTAYGEPKYKDPVTGLEFTNELEFYPGGRLRKGQLAGYQQMIQDPRTGKSYDRILTFDASGALLSGHISTVSKKNYYDLYDYNGQAELDQKGQIVKWVANDYYYASGSVTIAGSSIQCSKLGSEFTFSEDGMLTRALWSPECPVPVQGGMVHVFGKFPLELKPNLHVLAMAPFDQHGWVELAVGSGNHVRRVKWRAQQVTSRTGEKDAYPEIRFHDGDLDTIASGYLYEKTSLPLAAGGEKEFDAQTWVLLNQDGEVVDWKVQ
jgi:hypothetical protein